jgi:hypothetical protein
MRSTNDSSVKLPSRSDNEWPQLRLRVAEQAASGAVESSELAADLPPGLQTLELCLNDRRVGSIADGTDDLPAAAVKSQFPYGEMAASLHRQEALLP